MRPQIDPKKVRRALRRVRKGPLGAMLQAEMKVLTLVMRCANSANTEADWKKLAKAAKELKKATAAFNR